MTRFPLIARLASNTHVALGSTVLAVALLSGCATASGNGASTPASSPAFAIDQEVTFDGRVASIDTAPWAYDGNAIVVVDSAVHGAVKVQLPARYNLCRGRGIDTAASLKPGDRVRVAGTATDPDTLTVCEGAAHRIERI